MALKRQAIASLRDLYRGRILSLGYPDLLMTVEEAERLCGRRLQRRNDCGRWHGLSHALPDSVEFFAAFGATLDCVDIRASRGVERIVDLNAPADLGTYDLVLDAGTIEHCANIWQAFVNATNAVKVGGYIFHTPPMTMINHGFYNLNPTFFHDAYGQNGWNLHLLCGSTRDEQRFDVPAVARASAPPESSLYCLASRTKEGELRCPMQAKYLANPDLK
jgi:hypothetical protein